VACPVATIAAVGMMLDYLGDAEGASLTEGAIEKALREGKIKDLSARSGMKSTEFTDVLLGCL
jgi:3-isopropylmalate dehydrogenase